MRSKSLFLIYQQRLGQVQIANIVDVDGALPRHHEADQRLAEIGPRALERCNVKNMDRSVRPQDDFFRFVNGNWADKTPIPSDMSSYGTFPMLRDEASAAVRAWAGVSTWGTMIPAAPESSR